MYDISAYNTCGCEVTLEVLYDCECCGTEYGNFKINYCEAHSRE